MPACLCSQALATFGAAAVQYSSSTFGSHTGTETVGASALEYAGLKCSFHSNVPDSVRAMYHSKATGALLLCLAGKKVGYSIEMPALIQSNRR
jgi:hypothetical protein